MGEKECWGACIIGSVIVAIVSIVLFACSFSIIEIDQWGLEYDFFHQDLSDEARASGRYFVGIGNTFITFPRFVEMVDFSGTGAQGTTLSCWSKEGVSVFIDINFFIRLDEKKLGQLFREFGYDWYSYLVRIAYSRIKETTIKFGITEFYTNRREIAGNITEALDTCMKNDMKGYASLYDSQLRKIYFDGSIEESVVEKLVARQYKQTASVTRTLSLILKDIEYQTALNNVSIDLVYAEAQAQAYQISSNANTDAFYDMLIAGTQEYATLFNTLGITNDRDKIQFIYATELPNMDVNNFFIGLDSGIISV